MAAEAATWVVWDINRCPVTSTVDARRIGPCIKRALKNLGYTGRLTITAIGILTEVRCDIMRTLSSTGIDLNHVPTVARGVTTHLHIWSMENRPPANLMLISGEQRNLRHVIARLELKGYNIVRSIEASTSLEGCFLLKSLLARLPEGIVCLSEEAPVEEDENASFVCSTCFDEIQGFDSFIRHLNSKEHAVEDLQYYPAAAEAFRYCNYYEEDASHVQAVLESLRAESMKREREDEEDDKDKRLRRR